MGFNSGFKGLMETLWTKFRVPIYRVWGVRGGAVGLGTGLQAGRTRVRFPMVSLEFLTDIILPSALWPLDRLSF